MVFDASRFLVLVLLPPVIRMRIVKWRIPFHAQTFDRISFATVRCFGEVKTTRPTRALLKKMSTKVEKPSQKLKERNWFLALTCCVVADCVVVIINNQTCKKHAMRVYIYWRGSPYLSRTRGNIILISLWWNFRHTLRFFQRWRHPLRCFIIYLKYSLHGNAMYVYSVWVCIASFL